MREPYQRRDHETRRTEMEGLNFRDFIVYRCTPATTAHPYTWLSDRVRLAFKVLSDPQFPGDDHFTRQEDFVQYIRDNPHYRYPIAFDKAKEERAAAKMYLEYIDWLDAMKSQAKAIHCCAEADRVWAEATQVQ